MLTLSAPSKGKFLGLMTAGLASATLVLAASPAQALTQFAGDYAPGNWTQSIGGDGSIDTSGAPASIILRGADDGSGNDVNTDFTIAAPTAGTVSFDWNYSTLDGSPREALENPSSPRENTRVIARTYWAHGQQAARIQ